MFAWMASHWATLLIVVLLIALVVGIVVTLYRDKKKGRSSCGGNCGHCPMSGQCHKK